LAVYLVILGAAVLPDGSASGSLRRRCENAARFGRDLPGAFYLVTGGVGRYGPAEALVMRDLLVALGVDGHKVIVEDAARDTLESVRLCTRLLRQRGDVRQLLVCSSSYHNLRCTLLFRLAGFPASAVPAASDRRQLGSAKWLRYVLKEFLATPWDATLLLVHRMAGGV
jgi:uncharacterized SAM-binding protein YcdF (DUF218 family)